MPSRSSSRGAAARHCDRVVRAATLRIWGPFIKVGAFRAGDVVLSRGRGRDACVTAFFTGGRYSHAAIFLPFRLDDQTVQHSGREVHLKGGVHLDLVEADERDVGAVPPRRLTIVFGDGRRHDVIRLPGRHAPRAAMLLRHPAMQSVDPDAIEQAALAFNDAELRRQYSPMDRLAGPLPLPEPVKRLVGRVLLARNPNPEGPALPGCFCSELVAKFFERLDIPLFATAVAPAKLAPNHLVPSWSLLQVVPDAIISTADIPDDAVGEVLDIYLKDLRHYLPSLVVANAYQKVGFREIERSISEYDAGVKLWQQTVAATSDTLGTILHAALVALRSRHADAPKVRRMFDALLDRSTFLKLLREHLRSATLPDDARLELHLFHDQQVAALGHRILRARTIAESSAEEGREKRLSALADRRSQRAKARAAAGKPIPPISADDAAWVRKVLKEVAAKAADKAADTKAADAHSLA